MDLNNAEPVVGLPLTIYTSALGRGHGYPVCGNVWGNKDLLQEEQLSILDLAELATASYSSDDELRSYLHSVFDATALSGWNSVHAEPAYTTGCCIVDFPQQRTRRRSGVGPCPCRHV